MAKNFAWMNYIPDGAINQVIGDWQGKQPEREQDHATPSSLFDCPRVIWLKKHGVTPTNKPGWGQKQRFMLGRITENTIARQLKDEGKLIYHWKDFDVKEDGETIRFRHGEGLDQLSGTPDLLLQLDKVVVSDSKTSRSDSFAYVPVEPALIWQDPYWLKYKRQLEAYYLLLHWNKSWLLQQGLPVPEACHLFSYALDDGIVRREITWTPTKSDAQEVVRLTRRWNAAYASDSPPDCTCVADSTVLFCPMGRVEAGAKVARECCHDELLNETRSAK